MRARLDRRGGTLHGRGRASERRLVPRQGPVIRQGYQSQRDGTWRLQSSADSGSTEVLTEMTVAVWPPRSMDCAAPRILQATGAM